jgi:hypothetical protein
VIFLRQRCSSLISLPLWSRAKVRRSCTGLAMRRRAGSPGRFEARPDGSSTRRTSLPQNRPSMVRLTGRAHRTLVPACAVAEFRTIAFWPPCATTAIRPLSADRARGRCGDLAIMLADSGQEDGVTCHAGAGQSRCTTESLDSLAQNARSRSDAWRPGNAPDRSDPAAEPDLKDRRHPVERKTVSFVDSFIDDIQKVLECISSSDDIFGSIFRFDDSFELLS